MNFILLCAPDPNDNIVGEKREIPVSSGSKKEMRKARKRWEKLGETCRIVKLVDRSYVEVE
jgi:hypothetical protein